MYRRGDNLIIFCLLILSILLLLWGFKINANAAEEIPEEQTELFERTHEVDCIEFTFEDAQLLMRIADAEAHNQGPDGEWLVLSCLVNRQADDSGLWPDTYRQIIYQSNQFYTKGMKSEISPEAHEALARIEKARSRAARVKAPERSFSETFAAFLHMAS